MVKVQQVTHASLAVFVARSSPKSDESFREYVYQGKLKPTEIAAKCGFGSSAWGRLRDKCASYLDVLCRCQ